MCAQAVGGTVGLQQTQLPAQLVIDMHVPGMANGSTELVAYSHGGFAQVLAASVGANAAVYSLSRLDM